MKQLKAIALLVALTILAGSCFVVPAPAPEPEPAVAAKAAPHSILVRYRPGTPPEKRQAALGLANGKLDKEYKLVPGLERLTVVDTPAALQALKHQPFVLYAEPDYEVSIEEPAVLRSGLSRSASPISSASLAPDTTPNDPRFRELWGMRNINAPLAWDAFTGDPGVVVAIIDTGIDYTHPDLVANIWTNLAEKNGVRGQDDDGNGYVDDVHGYDFANDDGDPMDDHFHGTHVAGTVGAEGDNGLGVAGVNWSVRLMPVKFLNASGSGFVSGAISALEYAVKMRVPISSNSWGGGGYSQALYDAIQNAQSIGHLFVAAAGNSGVNSDLRPLYPAAYDLDNIISVAAIDDGDNLASFSNWGAVTVDLGAPGVSVLSTTPGGGYASYSGTSMATPHVSGVAALLIGLDPDWGYAELKDQILATSRPISGLLGKTLTGGALDADQAVNNPDPGPVPTPAPTPVPTPATPLPPFDSYALGDVPVEGRVRGSYQDTWGNDGVVQTVTERSTSGQPSTRYDQLEHVWPFAVPQGRPVIAFRAIAWSPLSGDGDSIVFDYSTDRVNWTEMFTVAATARTTAYRQYDLPKGVGGRFVYIRVRDTNRTPPSSRATDTVYVDYMVIRSSAQ